MTGPFCNVACFSEDDESVGKAWMPHQHTCAPEQTSYLYCGNSCFTCFFCRTMESESRVMHGYMCLVSSSSHASRHMSRGLLLQACSAVRALRARSVEALLRCYAVRCSPTRNLIELVPTDGSLPDRNVLVKRIQTLWYLLVTSVGK